MVSGSCAWTSIGKPKSVGRLPLTSCQDSPRVVAAHHVPVLLHEQHVGARRVHGDAVHAVADLGVGIGDVLGVQAAVDRPPGRAAVVGAERAGGRDGDEDALRVARVEQDRVQAHAAGARLPARPGIVAAQAGQLLPGLAAVGGAEQGGVLDAGVDRVRVGQRRLEVPDALELPGMRRAVVPLVRAGYAVVVELVADRSPRSCRRRRSAGSPGRTSRWSATRRSGSGRPASPSGGRSPSRRSGGR